MRTRWPARPAVLTAVVAVTVATLVPLVPGVPGVPAVSAMAAPASAEPKRALAVGTGGAVTSAEVHASRAGIAVLRRGGNAIDAAVATASALGVSEPFVAGPGGGGYMVIYLAAQHRVVTIDGRETCPSDCRPNRFQRPGGAPMDFEHARRSGRSVGVPGQVATWATAVARFGRHSFGADLRPAIGLASRGFAVDKSFRQQEKDSIADLRSFSSSRELFLTRRGFALPVGARFRNPDLARTYELLATHGPAYFYGGPLGADVARTVRNPPVSGHSSFPIRAGKMTARDVAHYRARVQAPTHVRYRGLDVYGMAPSSSGGITVGEALKILANFPMGRENRTTALFHYLEASRLAFADRGAYIGDKRFVPVPQRQLLSTRFAASRACLIGTRALSSPVAAGDPYHPGPCSAPATGIATTAEGRHTNHLVVVDRWGNVVSYTNTIEQLAGSGMTVPGRGFLLNNEMTDFDFAPPAKGAYDPNLPAPGKRPRSSMSPTIVLRHGRFDFAVGSPGGSTIITTVLQILVNHIDFRMPLPEALWAPRVSQRNASTSDAEAGFLRGPRARALRQRYGEKFTRLRGPLKPLDTYIGDATGVARLPGGRLQAVAERVREGGGAALVVHPAR